MPVYLIATLETSNIIVLNYLPQTRYIKSKKFQERRRVLLQSLLRNKRRPTCTRSVLAYNFWLCVCPSRGQDKAHKVIRVQFKTELRAKDISFIWHDRHLFAVDIYCLSECWTDCCCCRLFILCICIHILYSN